MAARLAESRGRQTLPRALFQELFDGRRFQTDEQWYANILDRDDGKYFLDRHDRQQKAVQRLGHLSARLHKMTAEAPVLAQGVALQPPFVRELAEDIPVRAIYLGNQNPDFAETMIEVVHEAKRTDPASNWMALRDWSDDRIRKYMARARQLSERRRIEAEQCGFPYVDMGQFEDFYTDAVPRIVGYLTTGDVKLLQS